MAGFFEGFLKGLQPGIQGAGTAFVQGQKNKALEDYRTAQKDLANQRITLTKKELHDEMIQDNIEIMQNLPPTFKKKAYEAFSKKPWLQDSDKAFIKASLRLADEKEKVETGEVSKASGTFTFPGDDAPKESIAGKNMKAFGLGLVGTAAGVAETGLGLLSVPGYAEQFVRSLFIPADSWGESFDKASDETFLPRGNFDEMAITLRHKLFGGTLDQQKQAQKEFNDMLPWGTKALGELLGAFADPAKRGATKFLNNRSKELLLKIMKGQKFKKWTGVSKRFSTKSPSLASKPARGLGEAPPFQGPSQFRKGPLALPEGAAGPPAPKQLPSGTIPQGPVPPGPQMPQPTFQKQIPRFAQPEPGLPPIDKGAIPQPGGGFQAPQGPMTPTTEFIDPAIAPRLQSLPETMDPATRELLFKIYGQ